MMDTSGSVKVVIFDMDDGWVELHMEDRPGGLVGREREPTDLRAGLIAKCKKKARKPCHSGSSRGFRPEQPEI